MPAPTARRTQCTAGRGLPSGARLRAVTAIAIMLLPLAAAAATPAAHRTVHGYLAGYDSNGDRRISLTEYQDYLSRGFDVLDRNRDGMLETAELPGSAARGSGARSRAAHRQALADTFQRQDVDRDGFLDSAELAAPPR